MKVFYRKSSVWDEVSWPEGWDKEVGVWVKPHGTEEFPNPVIKEGGSLPH